MTKQTILVIEDETSIQKIISTYLESAGYTVTLSDNGPDGLQMALDIDPALVVLDLNLPGMDGLEVATRLRQASDVYILILTARGDETDKIAGLRLGADDYLTKPFSPRELVARIEAILRRNRQHDIPSAPSLRFACVSIDEAGHEAFVNGRKLTLTATEFQLLTVLAQNAGRVLTREQLISHVWGEAFFGNDRVVDVYVGQVRRKLQEMAEKPLIETIRGVGYKFIDQKVA